MKIVKIEEAQLNEVVQFVSRVSGEDYNRIFEKYQRKINSVTDEVLVCLEGDSIIGAAAICTDVEGKYVELTDGIRAGDKFDTIAMFYFEYLKERFQGYQFDAVYKEENKQGIGFMERIGAKCVFMENEMKLTKENYRPLGIKKTIVPMCDRYIKGFSSFHDREHQNVYWTAERLIKAREKFEIFLALDREAIIGSIVSTAYEKGKKYIYFLAVDENYRRQGYARSLLEKSIEDAFDKNSLAEIFLCAEVENRASNALYQSVGFKVINKSNTYSIEQL